MTVLINQKNNISANIPREMLQAEFLQLIVNSFLCIKNTNDIVYESRQVTILRDKRKENTRF